MALLAFHRLPSISPRRGFSMDTIRESVRARYAETAIKLRDGGNCCDPNCCGGSDAISGPIAEEEYSKAEVAELGLSLGASLGCGNPTALAQLHAGEVVLDLGSGAGLDVLLLANENKARACVENATFLKGTIEAVPLADAAVDVVISNCVINLAADKGAVLREAFRVLRPDGRFAVADMIALDELAPEAKQRLDLWAGCVAGTISLDAYTEQLQAAGFDAIDIEVTREVRLEDVEGLIASAYIRARRPSRVEIAA